MFEKLAQLKPILLGVAIIVVIILGATLIRGTYSVVPAGQYEVKRTWLTGSVDVKMAPGFWLTGEVPRRTDYETGDPTQVVKSGGAFVPDRLQDDQSVVIETPQGLFVVLGCCHSGIINTLSHIVDKMGQSHIHTVIGGTHLGPVSENQREKSLAALKGFDIEHLGVSHCTGLKTAARLSAEYGDRFFFCNVGTVVEA